MKPTTTTSLHWQLTFSKNATCKSLEKAFILIVFFMISIAQAQVGIGTTTPQAALDVTSTTDGMLVPRVALTAKNVATPVATPTTSEMVYNTATAGVAPNNVVPGYYYWDGTQWAAFAYTAPANNSWLLTGNTGTTDGSNFVGTTDNVPLNIRVNNQKAGRIDTAGQTILGYQAANVTTATDITAIGYQALKLSTINGLGAGTQNTAIGYQALTNSTLAYQSTAVGYQALFSSITGSGNTAIGTKAMFSFLDNSMFVAANTAIGNNALYSLQHGGSNIALGSAAMRLSTDTSFNIAIGDSALNNVSGQKNVALGISALRNCTSGEKNTAIGYLAATSISNGYSNIAIGEGSGNMMTQGGNNISIGVYSKASVIGTDNIGIGRLTFNKLGTSSSNPTNNNIGIGFRTMYSIEEGNNNVALGELSGTGCSNGNNNVFIGTRSFNLGSPTAALPISFPSQSNNIFIGSDTYLDNALAFSRNIYSNYLNIGNVIYGIDLGLPTANIGIGTTNPTEKLEVSGKIKATSINFTGLPTHADDVAAGVGGLTAGDMYKTATGELRIKL